MIYLIRQDLQLNNAANNKTDGSPTPRTMVTMTLPKGQLPCPLSKIAFINKFKLPKDSVIKLQYKGKLIPWCMVEKCDLVKITVCRPHQNVKPEILEGPSNTDILMRKKMADLGIRLASLEAVADPATISAKTDRDLQLLTKQISFLGNRVAEADHAEWIKKT
ncbi:uncharacterized protein LOC110855966 [Folsomia candida]|uniref:Uncharacterized protein n=1 Tax=Folsomia candida TaxID=158441 RepID=A0A226DNM6_FOLCA|nr:uncharacterized protein LOC110855966 [Folsomia candida]OXA46700.1 hypothetical protein Fcan01_18431 [Folsomia candida]